MTYWRRFFLTLYAALFTLSIVLIDPWGGNRGEIWTQPKVSALWYITLLHLGFLLLTFTRTPHEPRDKLSAPQWRRVVWLWALFLAAGFVSALTSPAGFAAGFRAHLEMGDGWLYYALLAVFSLSNVLVLRVRPELFRVQLYGLLAAGFVLAVAMVPQIFDWTVDYTKTSGRISANYPEMLVSTMWKGQMPIGFYTSRGHAGFVLAATRRARPGELVARLAQARLRLAAVFLGVARLVVDHHSRRLYRLRRRAALRGLALRRSRFDLAANRNGPRCGCARFRYASGDAGAFQRATAP